MDITVKVLSRTIRIVQEDREIPKLQAEIIAKCRRQLRSSCRRFLRPRGQEKEKSERIV